MKRAAIITQARMTSTRLPGKVLMEAGNRSLLHYHIQRLKLSGLPVIIATTVNATDDPIVSFAEEQGIPFYRGSEADVLSRYYYAAREHELDVVVRVTSDCPLIDGNLIREAVDEYLEKDNPQLYISNGLERTFPRGFDFEVFSFSLLEKAFHEADTEAEREHVTLYINRNRSGNVDFRHIKRTADASHFRITVDTQEDFELIRKLIEDFRCELLSAEGIIGVLEAHPELREINAHIEQKKT